MKTRAAYELVKSRYGTIDVFANDSGAATQSLLTYGEWAENEIGFLENLVSPGSTVVDVGAYVGTHSLAFARFVGPTGLVIAIEAQPETFELLRRNVAASGHPHIQIENAVASCELGLINIPTIDVSQQSSFGSASLLETLTNESRASKTPYQPFTDGHASVRTITIDSLELASCALIKIDVEGVEALVLRGAIQTLKRCSPFVYCECNALTEGLKTVTVLENADYKVFAHIVDAFNARNFFNVHENIFANARELALVGVPAERIGEIRRLPLRPVELLLDIEDADDLALALLNKPQFQSEVLRASRAAKTGGVAYLDDYDHSKLKEAYSARLQALSEERDAEIVRLNSVLQQGDADIRRLQTEADEKESRMSQMQILAAQQDARLSAKDSELALRNRTLSSLYASKSWRVTKALRWMSRMIKRDISLR